MHASSVGACTAGVCAVSIFLTGLGCTRLFGRHEPVTTCTPSEPSLADAPAWVRGSPQAAHLPAGACVGADGVPHADRLCAVGEAQGIPSITQSRGTASQQSLRLLADALTARLDGLFEGVASAPQGTAVEDLSDDVVEAIGRVTADWQGPDCTTYALSELKRDDFNLLMGGPALSSAAKQRIVSDGGGIISSP